MSCADIEVRKKLLKLRQDKLRLEAPAVFSRFLGYSNPKYQLEWFHKLIADHCQMLIEGKIKNLMVFMPPQHGKLLPADTPVLTTMGWKKHGELKYGDYVFGADGKPRKVVANSGIYDWNVERIMFQGNVSILAAKEHLWKLKVEYDDHKGRREAVIETEHIFDKKHRRSPYIDCAPALRMAQRKLPIDPYILGLWLGDGLKSQGAFVSGEKDYGYMKQFGIARRDGKRRGYWRITVPGLRKALRENGLLNNKHIPIEYILASVEQREALLCGLMDTDGTVDNRGNCEFTQKKGQLAEDVYILLRTLGYKARKAEYDMALNGRIVGKKVRILFNPDRSDNVFRLARKKQRLINKSAKDRADKKKFFISKIVPHGIVKGNCIQVEGGMYLAGEDLIPTHNSEIISRNFPAWALGRNPDLKIVGCSYSADLAEQFSRSIQRAIDTSEYQAIFPETFLSGSPLQKVEIKGFLRNVDYFEIVGHRGFYKAVGVGGGLTGTPVDIAIIDDPVKDAAEANSVTYRQRVWDWYNTVLSTRLHNDSRQLFIMTRWHEDDLAGRILKAEPGEWTVLSIPAICEREFDDGASNRHIGDALWPERHSLSKLEKQKARAPREFSALYQQRPTIEGGNIVKRNWFQRISMADFMALRFREPMHFYLDTAYSKKKSKGGDNDPSGILAACRINNYIYIFHAMQVWKEMPDLLRFLPEYIHSHFGNEESKLNIEPKANGVSVVQMLREISTINVKETPTPQDDKEVRFRVVSPRIECGRIFLVEGSWNDEFLDEICGFPSQPHDEFVDILGYAINDLYEDEDELDYDALSNFRL